MKHMKPVTRPAYAMTGSGFEVDCMKKPNHPDCQTPTAGPIPPRGDC